MDHRNEAKKPLYQIVMENIMEQINSNNYSLDVPLCTEKQLIEKYGISRITAKRAITELEHQGILYRKRGLGSFVSRNLFENTDLIKQSSKIFPIILPFQASSENILDMIQTVNNRINISQCYLSLFTTERNHAKEKIVLKQLLNQDIAGLLYYPNTSEIHLDLLVQFALKNIPIIVLDKTVTAPFLHNVCCDNYGGSKALIKHLISLGHSRIGYVATSKFSDMSSVCERFSGYLSAMRESGLKILPEYVISPPKSNSTSLSPELSNDEYMNLKLQMEQMCKVGVTAVQCENNGVAHSTIHCCQELGITVPDEMSICCFDNSPVSSNFKITYISQNELEMAEKISEIFLDSLKSPQCEGIKIRVPAKLFIGDTTVPPKN